MAIVRSSRPWLAALALLVSSCDLNPGTETPGYAGNAGDHGSQGTGGSSSSPPLGTGAKTGSGGPSRDAGIPITVPVPTGDSGAIGAQDASTSDAGDAGADAP